MRVMKGILFILMFCWSVTTSIAIADQNLNDLLAPPAVTSQEKEFFITLQKAIKADDAHWVGTHVLYPISVTISGHKTKIRNSPDFEKRYKEIITDAIKKAVAGQDPSKLVKTPQGVMVENGSVWFDSMIFGDDPNKKPDVLVITINNT